METWPDATYLPQYVDDIGFAESAKDPVIRTDMDTGPAKQRLRYTAVVEQYTITMTLTKTERANFLTFYKGNLAYGSQEFNWIHPVTHENCICRFTSTYTLTPMGLGFQLTINMEVLP